MFKPHKLFTSVTTLFITSVAVEAAFVSFNTNFNSPGDLAANFTDGDASAYFSEQAGIGLDGSRAVAMPISDTVTEEIWTSKSSFSLSSGETYTIGGYFFQDGGASNGFGGLSFSANASNDSSSGDAFTTGNSSIGIAFYGAGYTFESVDVNGTVDRGSSNFRNWSASTFADAWNYVEFSLLYIGGDDFQVSAISYDASSDGSLLTSYTTQTQTFTNSDLAESTDIYVTFGSKGNRYEAFDVIPEPSSFSLFIGLFALAFMFKRKRM
jgi:hypothetical protein